jgi:Leucine-rich repeat (LRR) protein
MRIYKISIAFFFLFVNLSFAQTIDKANRFSSLELAEKNPSAVELLEIRLDKLTVFPKQIFDFPNLRVLLIYDADFSEFPDLFDKLNKLEILRFEDNDKLLSLPPSIGRIPNLTKLYIEDNESLKQIPESIYALKNLREITISGCEVKSISDSLANLTLLENIDFFALALESIPQGIFKIKGLRKLDLSHNQIKVIPNDLGLLTKLNSLSLRDNPITTIGEKIIGLSQLNGFDFDPAKLNTIDATVETKSFLRKLLFPKLVSSIVLADILSQETKNQEFFNLVQEYENVKGLNKPFISLLKATLYSKMINEGDADYKQKLKQLYAYVNPIFTSYQGLEYDKEKNDFVYRSLLNISSKLYILGKEYYDNSDNKNAALYFNLIASSGKVVLSIKDSETNINEFYNGINTYAAYSFYQDLNYSNAVPLIKSVLEQSNAGSNRNDLQKMLMNCYINQNNSDDLFALFHELRNDPELRNEIVLFEAKFIEDNLRDAAAFDQYFEKNKSRVYSSQLLATACAEKMSTLKKDNSQYLDLLNKAFLLSGSKDITLAVNIGIAYWNSYQKKNNLNLNDTDFSASVSFQNKAQELLKTIPQDSEYQKINGAIQSLGNKLQAEKTAYNQNIAKQNAQKNQKSVNTTATDTKSKVYDEMNKVDWSGIVAKEWKKGLVFLENSFKGKVNPKDCINCEGTGIVKVCKTCNKRGRVHCNQCSGKGYTRDGRTCLNCSGTGIQTCKSCGGKIYNIKCLHNAMQF